MPIARSLLGRDWNRAENRLLCSCVLIVEVIPERAKPDSAAESRLHQIS